MLSAAGVVTMRESFRPAQLRHRGQRTGEDEAKAQVDDALRGMNGG